ncbi:ABC transporter permease [Actinoplanes siamensis]|uniref:ABC transporter permease n=1 Tax=Actinoplanes siamensis TaxID=1223317 RepID=A0A919NEB9_9ACTN|nr:ABC transporter permease [Actinoplanes siamensis]GIF09030.1 ABC transporter permease [Actinoplanes siamensis]
MVSHTLEPLTAANTADAPAVKGPPGWRKLARSVRKLVGLAVIVVVWQLLAARGDLGNQTPTPGQVLVAAYDLIRSGVLLDNLAVSVVRVAKGLAIGLSAGLALGLVAGFSKAGEDFVDAPVQALRMLPAVALAPIFLIWFGLGDLSKVALIAFAPLFPLYLNVLGGIRGVDERLIESARSCGVGTWGLIRRVILPGALPQILVGLRQSLGVAWIVLVVAEQTATTSGLGVIINDAKEFLQIDVMFVVVVVYALLGLATDALVRLLERRLLSWRRGYAGV